MQGFPAMSSGHEVNLIELKLIDYLAHEAAPTH
jgi:hypothetical protein